MDIVSKIESGRKSRKTVDFVSVVSQIKDLVNQSSPVVFCALTEVLLLVKQRIKRFVSESEKVGSFIQLLPKDYSASFYRTTNKPSKKCPSKKRPCSKTLLDNKTLFSLPQLNSPNQHQLFSEVFAPLLESEPHPAVSEEQNSVILPEEPELPKKRRKRLLDQEVLFSLETTEFLVRERNSHTVNRPVLACVRKDGLFSVSAEFSNRLAFVWTDSVSDDSHGSVLLSDLADFEQPFQQTSSRTPFSSAEGSVSESLLDGALRQKLFESESTLGRKKTKVLVSEDLLGLLKAQLEVEKSFCFKKFLQDVYSDVNKRVAAEKFSSLLALASARKVRCRQIDSDILICEN